jgi:murein DD-endopeptidase
MTIRKGEDFVIALVTRIFLSTRLPFTLALSIFSVQQGHDQTETNRLRPPAGLVAWWPGDGNATNLTGINPRTELNGVTFTTGLFAQMRAVLAPTGSHPLQTSQPIPVDVEVPIPPTPVKADGTQWLLYELNVTNSGRNNVELVRVDVFKGKARELIATYTDKELSRRLGRPVRATEVAGDLRIEPQSGQPDDPVIGPGAQAIVYLLITVQQEADVPRALYHRLFFNSRSAAGNSQQIFEGGHVTVSRKKPLVLSAPLRGEGWIAVAGPSNDSRHRRASGMINGGKARIPQRFGIDWSRIDADGNAAINANWLSNNASFLSYGAEVLAVADAVVADVKDGIPENQGVSTSSAVPITVDTVAGNYVILDLGRGNFALYAHLQPRSIRLRVGQKVRRGQVLGLLGNSGKSEGPHLHFHVMNSNAVVEAEGVPYIFEAFEVQGLLPSMNEQRQWRPPPTAKPDKRRREIPIENAVIRFP